MESARMPCSCNECGEFMNIPVRRTDGKDYHEWCRPFEVGSRLSIIQGDITQQSTDAIVNAANSELKSGSGVCGAIHEAGGQVIFDECRYIRTKMGGVPPGQAVITSGGKLRAPYVIHTVGPVWYGGDQGEPDRLASAYRESLKLAVSSWLKTVSFPSISTGVYGYPVEPAARVALQTVIEFLQGDDFLQSVVFVLFDSSTTHIYRSVLQDQVVVEPTTRKTYEQQPECSTCEFLEDYSPWYLCTEKVPNYGERLFGLVTQKCPKYQHYVETQDKAERESEG